MIRAAALDDRLTGAQLRVLVLVADQPSTAPRIARELGHNAKTVRRHVAALVELGYIKRDGTLLLPAEGLETPDERAQNARPAGAERPTPDERAQNARPAGDELPLDPPPPSHSPLDNKYIPTGDRLVSGDRGSGGKGNAKRGTRLPSDWQPPDELRLWARQHVPGVDYDRELDKFRDYWPAVSGQRGLKLDWTITFRNWLRKAEEINGSGPRNNGDTRSPSRRGRDAFLAGVHSLLDGEQL